MKKVSILALTALVVALAVPTLASNTGFKLNYPLVAGNRNLVSLPYFYFPTGDIASAEQNAKDICADLATGDCTITQVIRFNKVGAVLTPLTQSCASPVSLFDFTPGEAYFVNASAACTADIVGSHDNDYNTGGGTKSVTITSGNNNVSIPYHVTANNAFELCDFLEADNGITLTSLVRITPTGPFTQPCIAPTAGFPITPGEGLFIVPSTASATIQWRTF